MKYFDVPEQNAAFMRFIDVFAGLIEKYGGNVVFPPEDDMKEHWQSILKNTQQNTEKTSLTNDPAA